jgi:hypothetical protein
MHQRHIFQILNHYTAPQDLDSGFGVLDNSANEPRLDVEGFIGGGIGWGRVRPVLRALRSYWHA